MWFEVNEVMINSDKVTKILKSADSEFSKKGYYIKIRTIDGVETIFDFDSDKEERDRIYKAIKIGLEK